MTFSCKDCSQNETCPGFDACPHISPEVNDAAAIISFLRNRVEELQAHNDNLHEENSKLLELLRISQNTCKELYNRLSEEEACIFNSIHKGRFNNL